jgi:multidrug efflux pump subunit AcrA (membrane-fusion protein)
MPTDEAQPESGPLDQAWREIDKLVGQVARLSKSEASKEGLYVCAVDALMRGLSAEGAALWVRSGDGMAELAYQVLPPSVSQGEYQASRPQLIELVLQAGRAGILPPHCPPIADSRAANPTSFLLVVCPWLIEGEVAGVIEVFMRPVADAEVQTGYVKYLEAIGELIADHQRARQLRDLQERLREGQRFDQFGRVVHASIDLQATAFTIANEGRLFLGCDRLSLLLARPTGFHLLAISGVDTISRHARTVTTAEQLCKAVTTMGEPLWYPEFDGRQPPEVDAILHAYLDESHASSLAVLPLCPVSDHDAEPAETIGALLVERFYGSFDEQLRTKVDRICPHCASALRNARELDELPFSRGLRKARWLCRNRRPLKILGVPMVAALVATLLCVVPADFRVTVRGELQPRQMQDVFARADGVVAEVRVKHGEHVAANSLLANLRRPQLDYEFKQVLGQLQTARQRLAATDAERVEAPRDSEEQRRQSGLLAAQGEELRETIRSLEAQHVILIEQQKDLEVHSPMEGEVLTWNVKQLLSARPVDRGQILMTVANLSGPWQLELRVPDRQIAHLLAAQKELGQALDVNYALGTAAAVKLRGKVRQVAVRAETPEGEDPYVQVFVDVDRSELSELVPGATVYAAIDCGRRCCGYVWFHDLIDAIRAWMSY